MSHPMISFINIGGIKIFNPTLFVLMGLGKYGGNEVPYRNICAYLHSSFLKQSLCQAPNTQHHVTHHSDF
jgi:hypothetical protein